MSPLSPERPSRRAATRRKVIVEESSDDDELNQTTARPPRDESEDDFTPAPQRSPRRQSRRKTTNPVPPTPQSTARNRRTRTGDNIDPPELFDPEGTIAHEPGSPTKKPSSTRKKRTVVAKKYVMPTTPESPTQLPTPKPSATPEPPQLHGAPLADITNITLNDRPGTPNSQQDIPDAKVADLLVEKPVDIKLRTRLLAAPQVEEPLGPRPRLVISHLVLLNFKSYAGRQEVGPFHASFSSVVGPNGSGKSNVIDSLLFVFGFRASKMRQGKISALIHNSAAHPNLEYCEVEVHFREVIDLAFRNNSSKYYINGQESNFTTVTNLLRARGVDLDHKRFLILQGEVESIAQMKPKAANEHDDGLLEYLEDIIGTSKYKSPIEESALEVETLNEVCVEKSARVQHVEKEKNSLEDKKNKALAFIRDENELVLKQSALYQVYVDECGDNITVTEEALGQMQTRLKGELGKHQGNEDEIRELQKKFKRDTKEYEALERETQSMLREMAKFDKENVKFEEKRKFLIGKQKKLEKTLQTSRLAASESVSMMGKCADDIERNGSQVASLEKSLRGEEKELASIRDGLKGKTQVFSDQVTAKQKSLEPWNARINGKQSAIAVAQSELDIFHEKSNAGAVALEEVETKIRSIESGRKAKLAELEECKIEKIRLEKESRELQAELDKVKDKEPEVRSQLSGARQRAEEARASLANTQTQGNVLTGLMRLKESGRIEGFHGRLGSLGTIDQRYDVAISTACPSLDNIVVDSVEIGQQCINYLRKNGLGRAMFILLDRLPQRDMSKVDTPEGVPRLFDLVKPKHEKFRSAFYSVMQNTLVATDLEQANRIAYGAKRWRVVTEDGQLIDKSGTMSGGGTRVARGAMSSKLVAETSKEQVSKLEIDRDAMEKKFQDFQERQQELENALKYLHDQIPQFDVKMQKMHLEIESSGRTLTDAQRRLKELSGEHQPLRSDDNRVAVLKRKIRELEKELENLHTETAGVEAEIKLLQDKIMEVGGVKLRTQKAKVDGLKEQIDTLNEEILSVEVAKAKAEKQKEKHEKMHAESENELEGITAELEDLNVECKKQTTVATQSRQRVEEAKELLETRREELAALKAELDEKTAEINELRAVEIEIRNKLEESQKILAENQKRSRYWEEKLSKLSLQKTRFVSLSRCESKLTGHSDLGEEDTCDELPIYTKDELADMDKAELKGEIATLEEKTQNSTAELGVLAEYRRRVEEHATRSNDLQIAVASRDAAKKRCDDLRKRRLEEFMEGFSMISLRLKEMYQMITMGGNAELELVDSLDPFSEGILFSVMPPKKSWKNISNLSGGEKTLSSLALVFALHHYKPTPLYVMDEIDAALDFRNVSIVASYIKERTKNAQFIVISLRNNMFELAARLVGVYKVNHMIFAPFKTKSVTIENREYISR
ncbi:hypothetical protein FGG08_003470 [Glutinoglossum americanum]|uniref:Structural maintenance of chromosomes protein n=1 Tax=Glutinoglossum americanum TaxID=1670608 RepID=A0A9P8ID77_9PEZI|nr:hypothetical protein FGG08_003470 [Glutinoglossum americanum]